MMRGWFDAFRENGGPTLYSYSNRTPVTADLSTLTLYIVFTTLFLAFVIIFPGVRRQRFTTFTSVLLSLFVGTAILIGQHGSAWHTAEAEVSTAYRAFSKEKVMADLGVNIGLNAVNVSLRALPVHNQSSSIDYNERFHWIGASQMKREYQNALVKGLPFPILTVGEYFTVDAEGFCWGRSYRQAGYYTSFFLWMSFALWLLSNLLLIVVPRYGAYLVTLTGLTLLFCNYIYFQLLPVRPLLIRMEQSVLSFSFGWSYWLVLVAGVLCVLLGGAVSIIDIVYPHKFSTILEVDFGTPFDRHTIIEDSQQTKKQKKTVPRLEEPQFSGFGSRILRRLSKRDRDGRSGGLGESSHDNYAFEMETPKSPWRYPHLMFRADSRKAKAVSFRHHGGSSRNNQLELPGSGFGEFGKHLRRTDSKDSSCSSMSSLPQDGGGSLRPSLSVPPAFQDHFNKFRRTDSESSGGSFASLGMSILSRGGSRKAGRTEELTGWGTVGAGGVVIPPERAVERGDSNHSILSAAGRKDSVTSRKESVTSNRKESVSSRKESASSRKDSTSSGGQVAGRRESGEVRRGDEVAIVVSHRKDSITNAVRRSSGETQKPETMW